MYKKSFKCAVTCASPPLIASSTGMKTNCFGAVWTDVRVKIRRVRSSSRAWIWTACGARSRFLAKTMLAICDEEGGGIDGERGAEGFDEGRETKYESARLRRKGESERLLEEGCWGGMRRAAAKSSRVVEELQSMTTQLRPNVLVATYVFVRELLGSIVGPEHCRDSVPVVAPVTGRRSHLAPY